MTHYKSNPYMSVELEYSFSYDANRRAVVHYSEQQPVLSDLFYTKTEDTISNPNPVTKFVSRPCTLSYWHEKGTRKVISKLFTQVNNSYGMIGTSCGYHVHISRKDMTLMHVLRFNLFFALHKPLVQFIARRADSFQVEFADYNCTLPLRIYCEKSASADSDRWAVNINLEDTIEVRAFRGTYSSNNFYIALEFVHSVYMFTKYHTSIAMFTTVTNKERLRNSYMDYVGTNRDYKRLYKQTI